MHCIAWRSSILRWMSGAALCLLALNPLFCLDSPQPLDQLYHSSWTAKDGLRGVVLALAQTSDGFLWIGTTAGLFRFDGLTFEAYKPEVGSFPSTYIMTLCSTPEGLWIGYASGGVSFLKNGMLRNYSDRDGLPVSRIRSIAVDLDGTVWVAAIGGLARLEGNRWHKVRMDWNFTGRSAATLRVDQSGTLWAPSDNRILFLPRGTRRFQDAGVDAGNISELAMSPDGSLWFHDRPKYLCVLRRREDGKIVMRKVIRSDAYGVFVDRSGAVWLRGDGVSRVIPERIKKTPDLVPTDGIEKFQQQDGLTGRTSETVFEDREGNIWVGTDYGLDRFRRKNLWWYRAPEHRQYSNLMIGDGGEIWAGPVTGPIFHSKSGKPVAGAPDNVTFSYRDPSGTLWLSQRNGIWKFSSGRFVKQPVPGEVDRILPVSDKDPMGIISATTDHSGRVWLSIGGRGEFYVKDGLWHFVPIRKDHPDWAANAAFADDKDQLWLANDAHLDVYTDGVTRSYDGKDGPEIGPIKAIAELTPYVLIGGELGLSLFHRGSFHSVLPVDGSGFGVVESIITTANDGVWLAAGLGIVHISAEEIVKAAEQPGYRVKCDVLDVVSDLPDPLHPGLNTEAIQGNDGTLWFATLQGFAQVNPRLYRNPLPPPVVVRSLTVDDRSYSTFADATLPPLIRNIRIDYTALSLSIPERVRFRYKLQGFDPSWRDAGGSRQAIYDNLKPGTYKFNVIACNNDGVWNESGAVIAFTILPAWYQTKWFLAACIGLGLLIVWAAYRYRLQQMAHAMSARFDERLDERTRIARELHDTLLQTIQASKMISDDALEKRDDPAGITAAMERISEWLDHAVVEGRAALNSLRSSTKMTNDLAEAFELAIHEAFVPDFLKAEIVVTGKVRELHPIVRDEIYRIGYEAIRNASLHSSATKLLVEIRYERDLTLRISDNGVGMAPEMTSKGKVGHFGLTGMRERAQRIAADLQIISNPGSGTTIIFRVPGHMVFITTGSKRKGIKDE